MTISRSGCAASFVTRWSRKSCRPPIPAGIEKETATVVDSPGPMAIEPMAGVGGQHPSLTSMNGFSANTSVASPTLVTSKEASTIWLYGTSPKST